MKDNLSLINLIPYGSANKIPAQGLSEKDATYWKDILSSVIRIAVELEMNLPDSYNCIEMSGGAESCLCKKIINNECKPSCLREDCNLKNTNDCNPQTCLSIISSCTTCTEAIIDCSVCKKYLNLKEVSPNTLRGKISAELKPTNNVTKAKGVSQVITDGSLSGDGGVEITTIGQYPDYFSLYEDYDHIIKVAKENRAWINERCSLHVHMLTQHIPDNGVAVKNQNSNVYYNPLEKPIPNEIGINFHQLLRRFEHVLIWMFSSGNSIGNLTRWEKFRQPILTIASPVISDMNLVSNILMDFCRNKVKREKYSTFNYYYSKFSDSNEFRVFHLEARFADGTMIPSVVASLGCILYAMLLKAVDISRYGVLSIGSEPVIARINQMRKALMNNNRDYNSPRLSNTSSIHKYETLFREEAVEFVKFLEPYLSNMGYAYDVLLSLADNPVSMRRARDNKTWEEIEKDIDPHFNRTNTKKHHVENKILEIIDLALLFELDNKDWIREASSISSAEEQQVEEAIAYLIKDGKIKWSDTTKTYIRN